MITKNRVFFLAAAAAQLAFILASESHAQVYRGGAQVSTPGGTVTRPLPVPPRYTPPINPRDPIYPPLNPPGYPSSPQYGSGDLVRCDTFSNGLNFSTESRDASYARERVISDCRMNSRTNNNECSANVACGGRGGIGLPGHGGGGYGGYDNGIISCSTFSNGLEFKNEGRDARLTLDTAINKCRMDSRTDNRECDANGACSGGGYGSNVPAPAPISRCSTTSNGLNFFEESRDRELARSNAVRQCSMNSQTNNQQCQVNAVCDGEEYSRPMLRCETFSNGQQFVIESRDANSGRDLVANRCRMNSQTNNRECDANAICRAPYRQY